MTYVTIFSELVFGYAALFFTVKLLGKTQISQITPFDFISALVLGDLVGGAIFDKRAGLLKILFAIAIWGTLILITEIATQKSRRMRYLLEGRPSIIINKGSLVWKEMKKNRLDIDQLQQLLRAKNIFSVQDVEYAILENNGSLSILKKAACDQPTCRDLDIKGEKRIIPITFISDGQVLYNNLHKAGLNDDWLQKQLKMKGIKRTEEICYAEWQSGNALFIQTYH